MAEDGKLSLSGIRTEGGFAKRLFEAKLVRTEDGIAVPNPLPEIKVDFSRPSFMPLGRLGSLALLLKWQLEQGAIIDLNWPVLESETLKKRSAFLERIGFKRFLEDHQQSSEQVQFKGDLLIRGGEKTVLPFRLFDWSWSNGEFGPEDQNWIPVPNIEIDAERKEKFRRLLRTEGFTPAGLESVIIEVVFDQLVRNVLIHSSTSLPDACGLYCGILTPREVGGVAVKDLSLAVVDFGIGIPNSLRAASVLPEIQLDLLEERRQWAGLSDSQLLEVSLAQDGTRCTAYEDSISQEARRGLTEIAEHTRTWGAVQMVSGCGSLTLSGGEMETGLFGSKVPGTQIEVFLKHRTERERIWADHEPVEWPTQTALFSACTPSGKWRRDLSFEDATEALRNARADGCRVLLIDCGFASGMGKDIEFWVKAAWAAVTEEIAVFWNVDQSDDQLSNAAQWIQTQGFPGNRRPFVMVGSGARAVVLGVRNESNDKEFLERTLGLLGEGGGQGNNGIWMGHLPTENYRQIGRMVNSRHLELGFSDGDSSAGFYVGRIHRMADKPVKRYFALGNHLDGSPGNVKRWATAVAAEINSAIPDLEAKRDRIVVLGLGHPLRELLPPLLDLLKTQGIQGYTLLTYDAPDRDELGVVLEPGAEVIMLSDVLSSGSLAQTVSDAVTELGLPILGLFCLVNLRVARQKRLPPAREASHFDPGIETEEHVEKGEDPVEYWLDPVSMTPHRRKPFWAEIEKTRRTGRLFQKAKVTTPGHFVDGTRHSSVHVDLVRLLARAAAEVEEITKEEVDRRLESAGWGDFDPSLVLYPEGISRIEKVIRDGVPRSLVTAYGTAVHQFIPFLENSLPDLPNPIGIPRAFDPDGRARVPDVLESISGTQNGKDVLIVDDAIASGQTARGLIRLGASIGAARILVVALLSRMSLRELEFWERLGGVAELDEDLDQDRDVGLRIVFPLHFPVGYRSRTTSPHEVSRRKLLSHAANSPFRVVRDLADNLASMLRPLRFGGDALEGEFDEEYAETWLWWSIMGHLAPESQSATEDLLNRLDDLKRASEAVRNAIVDVFLQDLWTILRHPRVRQTFRPRLETWVIDQVHSPNNPPDLRAKALALLRAAFRDSFLEQVGWMAVSEQPLPGAFLERALFNIGTLREDVVRRSVMVEPFLQRVRERDRPRLQEGNDPDGTKYLESVSELSAELRTRTGSGHLPSTPGSALLSLKTNLKRWADHELDKELQTIEWALIDASAGSGLDPDGAFFQRAAEAWDPHSREAREGANGIVPVLDVFWEVLDNPELFCTGLSRKESGYLNSKKGGAEATLLRDLEAFGTLLSRLGTDPTNLIVLENAKEVLKRLQEHVMAREEESVTLERFIRNMHPLSVGWICASLEEKISGNLPYLSGLTVTSRFSGVDRDQCLLLPEDLWTKKLEAGFVSNLQRRAFPRGKETDHLLAELKKKKKVPEVRIEFVRSGPSDPFVDLHVLNNGKKWERSRRVGGSFDEWVEFLEPLGGGVGYCQNANTFSFSTDSSVQLPLAFGFWGKER